MELPPYFVSMLTTEGGWSRHYRKMMGQRDVRDFKLTVEKRRRSYYSTERLRRRDVRDDDRMETSPYFVEEPKYLKSQLERENNSLRNITETALTKVKIYRRKTDYLLEEKEELKIDLEDKNKTLLYLNEELENLQCKNEEVSDRNRQLETTIYHSEFSFSCAISSLEWKIADLEIQAENHGREVKGLKEMLIDKDIELTDKTEKMKENSYKARILQEALTKQDELVSVLKGKIWHYEREVEKRNANITDQDKMIEREKRDIMNGCKRQVELKDNQISDLRDQLQQTLKTKADMAENIDSLEKEIQHLARGDQRRELERNDKRHQLTKSDLKEKDVLIADLKEQLQKSKNNMQSECEKDRSIESQKKQIQNLETEVQSFYSKARYQEEKLDRKRTELTQMCERNKVLEKTVNAKDDQLIETKKQLQQTLKTLREKEKEIDGNVTSRNKRIQHLDKEIERRDIKIKDLEIVLAHEETRNTERNALSKDIREKEDTIMYLKRKIQELEIKVQRYELEGNEVNVRQMKNDLKEKDDLISHLKDQLKQSTQTTYQPKPETEKHIESLKKEIQQLDAEIESLKLKVKHKEDIVDNNTIELTKMCDRNKVLENKLNDKDDQLSKAKSELQQSYNKEAELDGIITSIDKKIKHLETEAVSRDKKVKDLEERLAYEKGINRKGIDLNKEIKEKGDRITELKEKLEQTSMQLKKTETELDETKTRLSKAMGNKLTDNNPNITDLSDKNRPTKLAERYAELYDNQWTDAFDILQNHFHSEEKIIETLLQILQNAMHFCRTKAHEQMENLQRGLEFSRRNEDENIPVDVKKLIKDCRKAMSSIAVQNLCKMYLSDLRQSTDKAAGTALSVISFTEECIEITWFMMVQDPPVVFAPFVRHGDKLDTDLFKPYTSSGTLVDYMVWPALLLHDGGPVLTKGVAQGYGKKSK